MSLVEQKRIMLLREVEGQRLGVAEVAVLTGRSTRQVWRWLAAWREKGAAGVAHGSRGRSPSNSLAASVRARVKALAAGKYAGFNICHLTDLLTEREALAVSRSSVRRIVIEAGLERPRKRRAPRHRRRRERFPREGMLLQIDGSHHDWLGGRGPWLTLIGAVDDATGKVPWALFRKEEDSIGYIELLREIVRRKGMPLALYHDRGGVFVVNGPRPAEGTPGIAVGPWRQDPAPTQFGRLLKELGIESIISRSPQARGRIERLWGTFQDRLVSELRLAGADTIEEANRVLTDHMADHNRRFAVPPTDPEPAWRRPRPDFKYQDHFCFKYRRVVGTDNVVRHDNRRFQVLPCHGRASYARLEVEVREQLDGHMSIHWQGRELEIRPAPLEATQLRRGAMATNPNLFGRPLRAPESDHPWRRYANSGQRQESDNIAGQID